MGFLRQRHRQAEIMDQPDLPAAQHGHALDGLARINFFSRSAGILWRPLAQLSGELGPLRILDVATGAGDVPVRLWRKATRAGLSWQITGFDVSPHAVEYARRRASQAGADVSFFRHDVLDGQPLPPCDAVICSLFLHHLEEADAVRLMRNLARPEDPGGPSLVLINDLDRSLGGLLLARVGTRLLSASSVVHTDGPRSVEGAFTRDEARGLAERAGLAGVTLHRRWPCRWLLSWRRA